MGNFKSIEIGATLRGCYRALKGNELLALLGDRNFSSTGLMAEFFGKPALMPKGPAALALRTGATVLPTYMVREEDDTFRLIFEKPIYPEVSHHEGLDIERLIKGYLPSIENAIGKRPGQWYVFKHFWKERDGKDKRPDTII
jgi:KDO2-lipid IV(A) lauroyltransferase